MRMECINKVIGDIVTKLNQIALSQVEIFFRKWGKASMILVTIYLFIFQTVIKPPNWQKLVWINLYGREAVRRKLKNRQKLHFFVVLGCFWAYVGQPHNHIGWATPMSFASINPTKQRTNSWNFLEKILRIGGAGKWAFF